jgi:NAD(P) transhydrogenase subunit alpha
VALVPSAAPVLLKDGHQLRIEHDAGLRGGFTDEQYINQGAAIVDDRVQLITEADLIVQVRCAGANPSGGREDIDLLHAGQSLVGFAEPLYAPGPVSAIADRGVTLFSMELIPRITRAQGMDALSSQASLAGYKAVIRAADVLGKIFPMMMTAAGTIQPTKVFILGAGVAGLQAIATAKRLGAVVSAFDVRPAVREQVESLGGKFIQLPLDSAAEGKGGYAKQLTEEQQNKQRELMAKIIAESDVVITTALVPGKRAPILLTTDMVGAMQPGSVVVDLAAEKGGNCELTRPGENVNHHGVLIIGDENFAGSAAHHASLMYSSNVVQLLKHLYKKNAPANDYATDFTIDFTDEIAAAVTVCHGGKVTNPRVREALGLDSVS